MSDITTGIIYKIICRLDHKFCYIGSSFDSLRNRWQRHKNHYREWLRDPENFNPCSCVPYFKKYGIENFKIIEIKKYDIHLKDRKCLGAYETLWIRKTRGCCNKYLPIQYLRKEQSKQYRQENRERIVERSKQYRRDNKTEISEKKKQYRQDNKTEILEKKKQYRQDNKTEISEKKKIKVTCGCGSNLRKDDLSRHCKTKKHLAYLATQTE
jgi:hypothetical protein